MPDGSNKTRTLAFRDSVVLCMQELGVSAACRPSVSGQASMFQDRGQVHGLDWVIDVHCQKRLDFSGALNEVADRAEMEGVARYVTVFSRKNHPTAEAYAVMPLGVFARVIAV